MYLAQQNFDGKKLINHCISVVNVPYKFIYLNVLFYDQNSSSNLQISPEKNTKNQFFCSTISIKMIKLVCESLGSTETILKPFTMYAHRIYMKLYECMCSYFNAQIYSHPKRMFLYSSNEWQMQMRK